MNDVLFQLGGLSIYTYGLVLTVAFLWGAYVFFKKAMESHFLANNLFDGIVLIGFWGFVWGRLVFGLINLSVYITHPVRLLLLSAYPGIDRLGALSGMAFGLYLATRKYKQKYFDWLDYLFLGIAAGQSVFYALMGAIGLSWQALVLSLLSLILMIFLWRFEGVYRTISWYKNNRTSARSGFIVGIGLSGLGLIGVIENIIVGTMGVLTFIISGLLFVAGLVLVYIRSGRNLRTDIKVITKK